MLEFEYEKIMQPNTVVHCRTEEQANELLTWADSKGLKWCDDMYYQHTMPHRKHGNDFLWHIHEENTCYDLFNGLYGNYILLKEMNYKILSFEDALLKE